MARPKDSSVTIIAITFRNNDNNRRFLAAPPTRSAHTEWLHDVQESEALQGRTPQETGERNAGADETRRAEKGAAPSKGQ